MSYFVLVFHHVNDVKGSAVYLFMSKGRAKFKIGEYVVIDYVFIFIYIICVYPWSGLLLRKTEQLY